MIIHQEVNVDLRPTTPKVELYVSTAILCLLAFLSIVGAFLFSFPLGGIIGWCTGIPLLIGGTLMVVAAYNLPLGKTWAIRLGRYLMAAEFAWSFYKLFIYGESESGMFFVLCVVAGLLLLSPRVRRYESALRGPEREGK